MQSHHSSDYNPLNILAEYIIEGNTTDFIALYELLSANQKVLKFKPTFSNNSPSLHRLAMLHNRKDIFEYLIQSKISEKQADYTPKHSIASFYTQGLAKLMQDAKSLADADYWLNMFVQHKALLTFDINTPHDDLSILQIVCLLPEKLLQQIMDRGLLQKLIDMGAKPNIQFEVNIPQNDNRNTAIAKLISIPNLDLTPAILETLLIAYVRAGNHEMVKKFLIKMTGKDLEAMHAIDAEEHRLAAKNILQANAEKADNTDKLDKGKEDAPSRRATRFTLLTEENTPNLNAKDAAKRSAISYAAEANDLESVKLLLKYGASPLHAINYAIKSNHVQMTQFLLQHGGGMFTNLPASFKFMNINANDCFVQGMAIDGKHVTKDTHGFHFAIHNVEELRDYKERQDKLQIASFNAIEFKPSYRAFVQPLHCIKNALLDIDNDVETTGHPSINKALDMVFGLSNVSSLKFLANQVVSDHREDYELETDDGKILSLERHLAQIDPLLAIALFNRHPDKLKAIAILNDRVDELTALHQHLLNTFEGDKNKHNNLECAAITGCHTSYALPLTYGFYSLFAYMGDCCCECCGPNRPYTMCEAQFVSKYAMYFFGIPGLVVLGVVTAAIGVIIAYKCVYGNNTNVCSGSTFNPTIEEYSAIHQALLALGNILKNENLPDGLRHALQVIGSGNSNFDQTLNALISIRNHYQHQEIKMVQQDKSLVPYHTYQADLFFWTPVQRDNNRNVRLPHRLEMTDEAQDIQHQLGYELFTLMEEGVVTEDDALPVSITMSDDDIKPPVDETTPLFPKRK